MRIYAELKQTNSGDFALASSYDPGLVQMLKAQVPSTDRRWDPQSRSWLITEPYVDTIVQIVQQTLGIQPHIQTAFKTTVGLPETKMVKLEYLGAAKDRGGDEPVAFGFADGDWSVAIPLSVLQEWFELDASRPGAVMSLYAVLGVKRGASGTEIKKAFRRAARQWHPDVCKEPDAKEQFQRINEAYQVLSDERTRRKYDAGLALEASAARGQRSLVQTNYGWRPPLRCGWLLVEGITRLGRMHVSKIVQWEDITDARGRVMVSSWPRGGNTFQVEWV